MLGKIASKRIIIVFVVLVMLVALAFLFCYIFQCSIYKNARLEDLMAVSNNRAYIYSLAEPEQAVAEVGLPVRLIIPQINVDAKIDPMGITADGAMESPSGGKNVGWYKFGPRPGEIGSAVIDGHYGTWINGEGSVFDDLSELKKGDKISVKDDMGQVFSFVVRESRIYNPKADASDVFSSNDGKAHLNLVTCEGAWNNDAKSYPERRVVFTDKE